MTTLEPFHDDHNHTSTQEDLKDANIAKATAMAVLFLASFTLGNLPIKLNNWFDWKNGAKSNPYVKALLAFGGGVLMCTTFIHMLPEIRETFEEINLTPDVEIHYAETLMCVGFFAMYLVEEIVHVYLHRKEKHRDADSLRRGLSVRTAEGNGVNSKDAMDKMHFEHDHEKGHDHHTDHTHVVVDYSGSALNAIRGLLIVLALSVHELFEGLAVGLEQSAPSVWLMFGAVSAHKLIIAFCIGVELVTSGMKTLVVVIYVFTFAVVSPIGIGVGMIVTNSETDSTNLASVVLQGLASGTLLYVVFFEVLQSDRKSGLEQFCSVLVGFGVMYGVTVLSHVYGHHEH